MRKLLLASSAIVMLGALRAVASEVPAPGVFSNGGALTLTTLYGRSMSARSNDVLNPFDFGAKCNGGSNPLSGITSINTPYTNGVATNTAGWNLATWQAVFPFVTSLTQEIDWVAFQAAINNPSASSASGLVGSIGRTVLLPDASIGACYMGASGPLVANLTSLNFKGSGERQSIVRVSGDFVHFGLANGLSVATYSLASSGLGYVVGDALQMNIGSGTCSVLPTLTASSVDANGALLTAGAGIISTSGSCSVTPSNPLTFTDLTGVGSGVSLNGTWTSGSLTNLSFACTGSSYSTGDTLTATGGTGVGSQATFSVSNQVSGCIQSGGLTLLSAGSYGTPPPNPVTVTGGTGTGASLNFNSFNGQGGSLEAHNLQLQQLGLGGIGFVAQHDITPTTDLFTDVSFSTGSASACWTSMFSITGADNARFQRITANNNLNVGGTLCAGSAVVMGEQSNLLGRYEHHYEDFSILGFNECIRYNQTSNNPFQGLYFQRISCGQGTNMFDFQNGGTGSIGLVQIDNAQSQGDGWFLTGNGISELIVSHSNIILGNGRSVTIPTSCGGINITSNSLQDIIEGNRFGTAHNNGCGSGNANNGPVWVQGIFGLGRISGNIYSNAALSPNVLAENIEAGSNLVTSTLNQFNGGLLSVPIVDNGTNDVTELAPQYRALGSGSVAFGNANGIQLETGNSSGIVRCIPTAYAGGVSTGGGNYGQTAVSTVGTTANDTPISSTTMTFTSSTLGLVNGLYATGQAGLASPTILTSVSGSVVSWPAGEATSADIPASSTVTFAQACNTNLLSAGGDVNLGASFGSNATTISTLTSGGTITVPDNVSELDLTNSLVATGTVVMDPNPPLGHEVHFTCTGGVTTLSVLGNTSALGVVASVNGAPTTCVPSSPFSMKYIVAGRWQRHG